MEGTKLKWKKHVKHLGNYLSQDLSDERDIGFKKGRFYNSVNRVCALFGKMPSKIVNTLYSSYCTSFYGSQLWDFNSRFIKEMYIAWQKSIRRIWKLPYRTHTKLLRFLCSNAMHIEDQLMLRFAKLYHKMLHNENDLVSFITKNGTTYIHGTLGMNCLYIALRFKVSLNTLNNHDYTHFHEIVKNCLLHYEDESAKDIASAIIELTDARDGELEIDNLSRVDLLALLDNLCTD